MGWKQALNLGSKDKSKEAVSPLKDASGQQDPGRSTLRSKLQGMTKVMGPRSTPPPEADKAGIGIPSWLIADCMTFVKQCKLDLC